jgi:deazaflavin-dependent oxidoreductase (nitroreductase family)
MALAYRRPYGIYRWLAHAPSWFYQLGLGWLFGHAMVQITHRGRKSGVIRKTVLEVLHYDPRTREVLVVSGWEGKTDWYRNIEREPALEVRIGRVHYRPVQEFLSTEETTQLILTLFRQRPREVRFVGPLLGIDPDAGDAALHARIEVFFRGVRFRPEDRGERSV